MNIIFQTRVGNSTQSYCFVLGVGWDSLEQAERVHANPARNYSNVICELADD